MAGFKKPLFWEGSECDFWPAGTNISECTRINNALTLYNIPSKALVELHSLDICLQCTSREICLLCPYALRTTPATYVWFFSNIVISVLLTYICIYIFAFNSHEHLPCIIIQDLLKRKWGPTYLSIFSHEVTCRKWRKSMNNKEDVLLSNKLIWVVLSFSRRQLLIL